MSEPAPPRVVLIVDDIPDNLALLHDALDEAGYAVLVATDGASALTRAARQQPDVILLDALMPGMDGFEVARRLKADFGTAHIPIVFMTGLTETEHVVAAFDAGGIDYVTKPIRPPEVLARIAAHMQGARQMSLARNALDASGQATVAVHLPSGNVVWQTPLARRLLTDFLATDGERAPQALLHWLASAATARSEGQTALPLSLAVGERRLTFSLHEHTPDGEWLLGLREESDRSSIDALMPAFGLTAREAEVLYWVSKGKTNRDVGDILGLSPRTVHKHLEHIFAKLGVETRTAAATQAINKLRTNAD